MLMHNDAEAEDERSLDKQVQNFKKFIKQFSVTRTPLVLFFSHN